MAILSLGDLLRKDFPPQDEIIGGNLLTKGDTLVIGAPPKSYKSFLTKTLLVHLATATPLFNVTRRDKYGHEYTAFPVSAPQRVLYLEQEVGERNLKRRMESFVASLTPTEREACERQIFIASKDIAMRLDTTAGREHIAKIVDQVKPQIVALDPLKKFHYCDENNAQEMSGVLANVEWLKQRADLSFLIVHHTAKPQQNSSKSGPDMLRGSSVLFADAATLLMLTPQGRSNTRTVDIEFTLRHDEAPNSLKLRLNHETRRMEFVEWRTGAKREQSHSALAGQDDD